ncbi:TPA: peptidase-C39 like family protein [Legionella pneumophila]|nr:peptidase-C39 like family protein [Legionella pneumophila]
MDIIMIDFKINSQPDDESCGPTCLHAIYQYYGLDISYEEVANQVESFLSGGTIAPMLGKHALQLGFKVTLYVNNLQLYDPTWFNSDGSSNTDVLREMLMQQMRYKRNQYLARGTHAALDFLTLGGAIYFRCLTAEILKEYFARQIPILTGLNSTYLYNCSRELFNNEGKSRSDPIRGLPCGHFVVLCGYNQKHRLVVVADPYKKNPVSGDNYYTVSIHRLINAIMLGVVTRDGNLLIIEPKNS